MTEDLKTRLEECQVGIASRGQQQPDGTYLVPNLWEQLRQRLQGIYRRATGEADAVLSVDQPYAAKKPWPKCRECGKDLILQHADLGFCNVECEAHYRSRSPTPSQGDAS